MYEADHGAGREPGRWSAFRLMRRLEAGSLEERETLVRARRAMRQGDKATAQTLLYQVIRANPHSETAWLWLSAIVGDPAKERDCLERVLRINPDNATAERHLAKSSQSEVLSQQSQPAQTESRVESASSAGTSPRGASRTVINYLIVGGLVVGLVFGLLSSLSLSWAGSGGWVGTAIYAVMILLSSLGVLGFIVGIILSGAQDRANRAKDKESGTVVTTYASDRPLTTGQRREILERAIGAYVSRGYQVTSQTNTSAQMVKKKQFSCLSAILLLFTVFGWILYLIYYWSRHDELVYLYVDEYGNVVVR